MSSPKALPTVKDDAPEGIMRVTLINHGAVVGFGERFPDGWTRLQLIESFTGKPHTYMDESFPAAFAQTWDLYPGLDWERTCGDASA